jgi:uncharacterized phage protein gp47/JayE
MAKSVTTIVQSMISYIRNKFSTADVSEGTPLNDIVITAPARVISQLYSDLDLALQGQALDTASDAQLEVLGKNVGVVRKSARPARGTVTFYCTSAPTSDIVIPVGTVVSTVASSYSPSVQFQTTRTVTMYGGLAGSYLNPATGRYEISTDIIAIQGGLDSIVGANTISLITTPVANIDGCYNTAATAYGADQESSDALQLRIGARVTGNSIGSEDGYLSVVTADSNVQDAVVVAHGATGRAGAGAVDIYIKGNSPAAQTDIFSSLSSADMIFSKQPVISGSIVGVQSSNSGSLDSSLWAFVQDTGVYRGSIDAVDTLHWNTLLDSTYGVVYVTYNYNALVDQLQTLFTQTNKDVFGTDVLVKWAQEVYIDITTTVKVLPGFDTTTVLDAIEDEVITYLDSLSIGEEVQQADVARIMLNVAGVDDVLLPFTLFQSEDGTITRNASNNLTIPAYAYAQAGLITLS